MTSASHRQRTQRGARPRRASRALPLAAAIFAGALAEGCRPAAETARSDSPRELTAALSAYGAKLDSLDARLDDLERLVASGRLRPGDSLATAEAWRAFRESRRRFKRVEMLTEYYAPWLSLEINGPAITRAEEEDPDTPLPPSGFQAVERALFPAPDSAALPHLGGLVRALRGNVAALRRAGADTLPGESHYFDAARQEIARVATLGIAGFDASLSGDAVPEAADALEGVRESVVPWRPRLDAVAPRLGAELDARFDSATRYLRAHPGFAELDRLAFIVGYIQPLAHALGDAQTALGIGVPVRPRAWSKRAASVFDRDAIDPAFFAPPDAPRDTAAAALGRALFFEPHLSPSGTRSCASCHRPERAFTDGRPRAALLDAHGEARSRNTPTLLGVALQPSLFADERAHFLEDQVTDVLGSRSEMGGSLARAAEALRWRADYRSRFALAFGAAGESTVSAQRVRFALAAYLRTLSANASRVDRALGGDLDALTASERRGFNLFMGSAGCGTCHFAPLFNGAMPPAFTEAEPEVIGVPERWRAAKPMLDPDPGRWGVRRTVVNRGAFKPPAVRNIALTAPYMHNGALRTLEDVVDFYDIGGGRGLGLDVPNQTLPPDSLHLSAADKRALVAFLRALTDTTLIGRDRRR